LEALEEALQDDPVPEKAPEPEAKELTEPEEPEEPEEAEEPEEPEEAEEAAEQPRDEKGKFTGKGSIPVDRHKAVLEKEREARDAAERRAAELERQLVERQQQERQSADVEAAEAKIGEMEKQYSQLLLDGEADKAAQIMSQIRKAERQIATAEAEQRTAQRTTQILESERVELAIAQAESQFPQLNPESAEFDEQIVNFVLAEQQRLIKTQGFAPSKALGKAAESVMKRFAPQDAPEPQKGLGKAAGEGRKAEQVKKNLAASKSQPASMKDSGMDSDKAGASGLPDPTKMTSDEWAALPEATKARLRGDVL
jgi:hypothetical protein